MPTQKDLNSWLRSQIAAQEVSLLEVFKLLDAAGREYHKENPLKKPSQEKLWQLVLEDMKWWCIKHGISPRQLLSSRIRSKVVLRPGGGATISVRSKQGDVLLTYRWSPKKGLWTDGSKTRLLPLGLRSEVRRAATVLREQHRRIYSDAQKPRGRVHVGAAEKRR